MKIDNCGRVRKGRGGGVGGRNRRSRRRRTRRRRKVGRGGGGGSGGGKQFFCGQKDVCLCYEKTNQPTNQPRYQPINSFLYKCVDPSTVYPTLSQ